MIHALAAVSAPLLLWWLFCWLEHKCEVKDAIEQKEMLERMNRCKS